jgi:hypothetical protein
VPYVVAYVAGGVLGLALLGTVASQTCLFEGLGSVVVMPSWCAALRRSHSHAACNTFVFDRM